MTLLDCRMTPASIFPGDRRLSLSWKWPLIPVRRGHVHCPGCSFSPVSWRWQGLWKPRGMGSCWSAVYCGLCTLQVVACCALYAEDSEGPHVLGVYGERGGGWPASCWVPGGVLEAEGLRDGWVRRTLGSGKAEWSWGVKGVLQRSQAPEPAPLKPETKASRQDRTLPQLLCAGS